MSQDTRHRTRPRTFASCPALRLYFARRPHLSCVACRLHLRDSGVISNAATRECFRAQARPRGAASQHRAHHWRQNRVAPARGSCRQLRHGWRVRARISWYHLPRWAAGFSALSLFLSLSLSLSFSFSFSLSLSFSFSLSPLASPPLPLSPLTHSRIPTSPLTLPRPFEATASVRASVRAVRVHRRRETYMMT